MDAKRRQQILFDAARSLDPDEYNLLVSSVAATRAKGRLRFWQEELFALLEAKTATPRLSFEEYLVAFTGAERLQVDLPVITKIEFLRDPNSYLYSGREIPDEWITEAWETDSDFRDNMGYEYVREASKNGDLGSVVTGLRYLARILPLNRLVELYRRIRDNSPHRESEFRPTFERLFGDRMTAFPPPLTTAEIVDLLGRECAEALGVLDSQSGDRYPSAVPPTESNDFPSTGFEDIPF